MSFQISPPLSLLALCAVPPGLLIQRKFAVFSRAANRGANQGLAAASSLSAEAISNLRTVRANGGENGLR